MKINEKNLEVLKKSMNSSTTSIIITSVDGQIEYVNPEFEKRTGYKTFEVIGKNPKILKSGNTNPDNYKNLWETIRSGNTWSGEFQNKRKNGTLFWEYSTIYPIVNDDDKVVRFLAVKEDITSIKKMDHLFEKEILKGKVQTRIKFDFLDRLSHEIRTPFNIIISFTELLRNNIDENEIEELSPYLLILKDMTSKLAETIEFILNISEVNSKENLPKPNFLASDFLDKLVNSIKLPTQTVLGLSTALELKCKSVITGELRAIFNLMLASCKRVIATVDIVEYYSKESRNELEFLIKSIKEIESAKKSNSPNSKAKLFRLPRTRLIDKSAKLTLLENDLQIISHASEVEKPYVTNDQLTEMDFDRVFNTIEPEIDKNEEPETQSFVANEIASDRFIEIKTIDDIAVVNIKFKYANYLATRYFNDYYEKHLLNLSDKIIFDFSLCSRVDSCFLGLLIKIKKSQNYNSPDVALVLNYKKVASSFMVSHLESFFTVAVNFNSALEHFPKHYLQKSNAS